MRALPDRLSEWIAAAVNGAGLMGGVFDLSGNVDSAVVAALCKRALGAKALGVLMPGDDNVNDESDARLTAETFGLEVVKVDLDGTVRSLLAALPQAERGARFNLMRRLRSSVLYYWAKLRSSMVVGAVNRSEWLAGYFTKYGDGGVDLLPLGGLYKTEVLRLARELGVPERIVEKPASLCGWRSALNEGCEPDLSYTDLDAVFGALEAGRLGDMETHLFHKAGEMKSRSHHKRALPKIFEVLR